MWTIVADWLFQCRVRRNLKLKKSDEHYVTHKLLENIHTGKLEHEDCSLPPTLHHKLLETSLWKVHNRALLPFSRKLHPVNLHSCWEGNTHLFPFEFAVLHFTPLAMLVFAMFVLEMAMESIGSHCGCTPYKIRFNCQMQQGLALSDSWAKFQDNQNSCDRTAKLIQKINVGLTQSVLSIWHLYLRSALLGVVKKRLDCVLNIWSPFYAC